MVIDTTPLPTAAYNRKGCVKKQDMPESETLNSIILPPCRSISAEKYVNYSTFLCKTTAFFAQNKQISGFFVKIF
ncbi:MAG: hypothetical protein ACYSSL_04765 [Planctomycetota bacterium]|jgi:hypothetical protein